MGTSIAIDQDPWVLLEDILQFYLLSWDKLSRITTSGIE